MREHSDTPPSKVKVKTLESQTPLYIPPPSTVASVGVTKLNNGGVATGGGSGVLIVEKRNIVNQTSPLPSLQKYVDVVFIVCETMGDAWENREVNGNHSGGYESSKNYGFLSWKMGF